MRSKSLLKGKLNRVSHPKFFCYAGSVERDLTGFPVVTLQFSGGAQLGLDTNSMFFQLSTNVLCMAIGKSFPDMNGVSVIGVLAQQSYNIGYDIKQGKIFFQRIDCSALQPLWLLYSSRSHFSPPATTAFSASHSPFPQPLWKPPLFSASSSG
ncbi:hypothetical protein NL676_036468 [Syzygium grande]|nr:hypothetical protein NL676_036468 [Syzygium grande]